MKMKQEIWKEEKGFFLEAKILRGIENLFLVELLWYANLCMLSDVFEELVLDPLDYKKLFLWIGFVVILKDVLQNSIYLDGKTPIVKKILTISIFGIITILILDFITRIKEEFLAGWYGICDVYLTFYNVYYKTNFWYSGGKPHLISGTLLITSVALVLITYWWGRSLRCKPLLFIPSVGILILQLTVGYGPEWESVVLLVISGVFLLNIRWHGGAIRREDWIQKVVLFGALAACFLILQAGGDRIVDTLLDKAPEYKAFERSLETTLKNMSIFSLWEDPNEVDNQTPDFQDKKLMQVRLEKETPPGDDLYIRTNSAMYYGNGSWYREDEEFETACNEAGYELNDVQAALEACLDNNEVNPNREGITTITYLDKVEQLKQEKNASLQWGADAKLIDAMEWRVDGEQRDLWIWYFNYLRKSMRSHYKGDSIVRNVFQENYWYETEEEIEEKMKEDKNVTVWYAGMDVISEGLDNLFDMPEEEWRLDGVSDGRLLGVCDIMGTFVGDVQQILMSRCKYQLYLNPVPQGMDTIEYFLNESREGYCVHFASAATLMLQKIGIPARFCTGYIVKKNAFVEEESGIFTAEVIDRNAHAWTEVYFPGVGWLPCEVTPGYNNFISEKLPTDSENVEALKEQRKEQQDLQQGENSSEEEKARETEKEREETTPNSELESEQAENKSDIQKEHTDSSGKRDWKGRLLPEGGAPIGKRDIFRILLVGAGVLVLLAALGSLPYLYQEGQRRQEELLWQKRRYRRYVKWRNRKLYQRLKNRGFLRGKDIADQDFAEAILKWREDILYDELEAYMAIVKKAAFSYNEITEEEARLVKMVTSRLDKRE